MKLLKRCLMAVLILLSLQTIAQKDQYKPLKIGDRIPEVTLVNMKNYKSRTAKISDFKGKLVILDFWSKGCSSCIMGFPKMQEFQKEFGDKIQIILVTTDAENDLATLFKNSPILKNTTLPIVIGDKDLNSLFPHVSQGYYAWLNSEGEVIGMGGIENVTKKNIQELLEGKDMKMVTRIDENINGKSLLDQMAIKRQRQMLGYYSIITGNNKLSRQGSAGMLLDSSGNVVGFSVLNSTIPSFFYSEGALKTIVEVKDAINMRKYFAPNKADEALWLEDNTYCYEISFPKNKSDKDYSEFQRQDMERFFNVKTVVEERPVKCIVLYNVGEVKFNRQDKVPNGDFISEHTIDDVWIFKNAPMGGVISGMVSRCFGKERTNDQIPTIDETNYSGKVNAEIKGVKTLKELDSQLKKYGLGVKEEIRNIKCLIIKEL